MEMRQPNPVWWVTFLVYICVSITSCSTDVSTSNATPESTPAVLALMETRTVAADEFTIAVPRNFEDKPWHGIDSTGWTMNGDGMAIDTESGPYAADAKNYGFANYRSSYKTIDGENAQVAAYQIPAQQQLVDPKKRNCVAAYFDRSEKRRSELKIGVCFDDPKDEQLAMQIIESIKFRDKSE
jgi:hypothetical protein